MIMKFPILKGPKRFITPFKGGYTVVSQIDGYLITVDTTKDVNV